MTNQTGKEVKRYYLGAGYLVELGTTFKSMSVGKLVSADDYDAVVAENQRLRDDYGDACIVIDQRGKKLETAEAERDALKDKLAEAEKEAGRWEHALSLIVPEIKEILSGCLEAGFDVDAKAYQIAIAVLMKQGEWGDD